MLRRRKGFTYMFTTFQGKFNIWESLNSIFDICRSLKNSWVYNFVIFFRLLYITFDLPGSCFIFSAFQFLLTLFPFRSSSVVILISRVKVKWPVSFNFRSRFLSASKVSPPEATHVRYYRTSPNCQESISHKISSSLNYSTSVKAATMKPTFERLPKNVTPSHYELQLQPDLINFTFAGSLKTSIKVSRSRQTTGWFATFRCCITSENENSHPPKNNETRHVCVHCADVIA